MSLNATTTGTLVSAVVPAYNAARYIGHTLRSLVTQSYPHLEIIVVDDGSHDATVPMVQEMARLHPQIRVIQQPNAGVAAARNCGVQASRGEFIAPVDADDVWFPEAAARLVARLQQSERNVGLAYGWSLTMDENGWADGNFCCSRMQGEVFRTLPCHNFVGNTSATMIRRSVLEQVGGYDCQFLEHGAQGCEDWDLYLRIAERTRFCVVPEFLVGYRKSRDSMTSNTTLMAKSHTHLMRKMNQRHPDIPNLLYRLSTSSFYHYLACECHRQKLPRDSYRWLYRAMASGTVFTLLRPSCYGLAAKNALAMYGRPSRYLYGGIQDAVCSTANLRFSSALETRVGGVSRRRLAIQAKLLVEDILHRVVTRMPISCIHRS